MIAAICWGLIYVARTLEWSRRHYEQACLDALGDYAYRRRPVSRAPGYTIGELSRTLLALVYPVQWCHPAACWLTSVANRGLPPLGKHDGYLTRLYQ